MISDLVNRAKEHDQAAWSQLYNQTCKNAYFVALKVCGQTQDAMDLVHDAFLTAYTQLDQLQNPEKFQSWLNIIVANKCRDYLKKKRPMLFSELDNTDAPLSDWVDDRECNLPEQQLDREETSRIVGELIEALPEDQRLCVLLYYRDEMSVADIAAALQVPEGTVKSRLNYARRKVADKVKELEKKGTKLYGLAPIPFLIWLLRAEADAISVPAITASGATATVVGSAATASGAATAAKASMTAGIKNLMSGIGAKVVAGIAAAAIVVGGGIGIYNTVSHASNTFDLNEYLIIEGFNGLNGQGTITCYLDEEALAYDLQQEYDIEDVTEENANEALLEGLRILDEISNVLDCITVIATPENGLSNGDTVTVTAKFENTLSQEINYKFSNAQKTITVSGLTEGKVFDPFAEENIVTALTGFSGVGQLSLDILSSENLPEDLLRCLNYKLSKERELNNGDTVTITVMANQPGLESLGYLMPEKTEKEITVSGLPELVDTTYQFSDEILQPLFDAALAYSQADEQEYTTDYTITSPSRICGVYFINSLDRQNPYSSIMDGLVAQNAIVVATNYVMEYNLYFHSTVSRTFVTIYPNWAINADGKLTYESESTVCKFALLADPDNFTEWMDMEFNYLFDQVEIVLLES